VCLDEGLNRVADYLGGVSSELGTVVRTKRMEQFPITRPYLGRHDIRLRDDVTNWQLTQGNHRINVIGWQDLHSDNADSCAASGARK
jgi:hypothetical protein